MGVELLVTTNVMHNFLGGCMKAALANNTSPGYVQGIATVCGMAFKKDAF